VAVKTPDTVSPGDDPALDKAVEILTKASAALPGELRPAA
jgi:hypothetical protein